MVKTKSLHGSSNRDDVDIQYWISPVLAENAWNVAEQFLVLALEEKQPTLIYASDIFDVLFTWEF